MESPLTQVKLSIFYTYYSIYYLENIVEQWNNVNKADNDDVNDERKKNEIRFDHNHYNILEFHFQSNIV